MPKIQYFIQAMGKLVALDEKTGIDVLGDMIEASDWSVNKQLYGSIHNMGHVALCYIHDPDLGHSVCLYLMTIIILITQFRC